MPQDRASTGEALAAFQSGLYGLRDALQPFPELHARLFAGAAEWIDLLEYKLAPNLGIDPCLVVAIAGGTNTGKSTVYNLLLEHDVSPVRLTAAATCRPVLAASPRRAQEFSAGRLLSAFRALPLTDPNAIIDGNSPKNALYITATDRLPEQFVLLDTPDIDSIDLANWEIADHIRAAGDVVVAVLTGEKYKDVRVVEFFRAARAAGRRILPLMNKANPANDFATARTQLREFAQDIGLEHAHSFAIPHDFTLSENFAHRDIAALEGTPPLFDYLASLDAAEIKEHVYRDTLRHFAREAEGFLGEVKKAAAELQAAERAVAQIAQAAAQHYEPKPGAQIGAVMLEFVHSKRGVFGKAIGTASKGFLNLSSAGARYLSRALLKRDVLGPPPPPSAQETDRINEEELKRSVREVLSALYAECDRLPGEAGALLRDPLDALDADTIQVAVLRETIKAESVSADFKRHAFAVMDTWWQEERTQRMLVEFFDTALMVAPAAFVLHTIPGTGIGEYAAAVGSSFLEQVAIRALLLQFGGRIVPLIAPWQTEQREALAKALADQLAAPALANIRSAAAVLEGDSAQTLNAQLSVMGV